MLLKKTKKPTGPAAEPGQIAAKLTHKGRLLDSPRDAYDRAARQEGKQRATVTSPPAATVDAAARSRLVPQEKNAPASVEAARKMGAKTRLKKAMPPAPQQNHTRVPVGGGASLLKKSRLVD